MNVVKGPKVQGPAAPQNNTICAEIPFPPCKPKCWTWGEEVEAESAWALRFYRKATGTWDNHSETGIAFGKKELDDPGEDPDFIK